MPIRFPGSSSRAHIPDWKDSNASPTFVHPHPRHGGRRLRPTSANHPAYLNHNLHLVNDTAADNYDSTTNYDDDRSPSSGANVNTIAGTTARGEYAMSTGDRGSHPPALGQVRSLHGPVGDHDRMARIELSARRGQPDRLLLRFPDGFGNARRVLRGSRVPGLVCGALRRRGQHCGSCTALRVCWFITLATLTWVVL
tara:strand:+ start:515 stop:1105 length:591 start_codon:yes stop_codon:yes gene_type:complete